MIKRRTIFQAKGKRDDPVCVQRAVADLRKEVRTLVSGFSTKGFALDAAKAAVDTHADRLDALRDDAVRALSSLVRAGVITREQLCEDINSGKRTDDK